MAMLIADEKQFGRGLVMTMQLLLSWWNLIFELPFGLGLLYLALYTLSGWTFGEAGAEMNLDHDVDASLDADGHISFEHDADAGADSNASAEHDADQDHNTPSGLFTALSWLGVGKAPLSIVLMVLMLSWGAIGFAVNQRLMQQPLDRSAPAAIIISGIGSLLITRFVSVLIGKYLPSNETYARRRHELLGSLAEALYPIDAKFGMAIGRDDRGERFEVACRTEADQEPVAKGSPVQLVGYSAKERMFFVVPAEGSKTPRQTNGRGA